MVHGLELESAVEEVEPGGTLDVHRCAEHALWEGFGYAEVGSAHGEVGEGDLDVHGHGNGVAEEDEEDAGAGGGDGFVDGQVAEPVPEEELAGHLEVAVPPRGALAGALPEEDVLPAQEVEVEAAEGEDGVVEVVLVLEQEFREAVVGHDAVVVGALQTGEEAGADGEEGHVLDVRVVGGGVGDEVVDVVVALPPAAGEAAEEVGNHDADAGVGVEVVGDAHVAGVVDGEDELVPEGAEEEGREGEVLGVEAVVG